MNAFTRCPNGNVTDGGAAHDFDAWPSMVGDVIPDGPLLFCRRCGEVRPLEPAPTEPAMAAQQAPTEPRLTSSQEA